MSDYIIPAGYGEAEYIDKKSRFIGQVQHAESVSEAMAFVESVRRKHADATHNVWAYVLADGQMRWSDDGEPGGTSGQPTLNVFRSANVCDVVCVVTRYFGGVLLGTGGLVRAYTQSTQAGIDAAQLVVVSRCVDLRIRIAYPRYEQLMRLAEDHGAKVLTTDFADAVTINLRMLDGTQQPLLDALTALERGQEDVEISDPIDAAF